MAGSQPSDPHPPGVITGILKRRGRPWLLKVDGCEWDLIPATIVRMLEIDEGETVDLCSLAERMEQLMPAAAWERALALVSSRERSTSEILAKLSREGYPSEVSRVVVERLQDMGAVDDARYAAALARTKAGVSGRGRDGVRRSLVAAGVEESIVADVLDDVCPAEGEALRAREAAERMLPRVRDKESLAARLLRRGFSPRDAWSAAAQAWSSAGLRPSPDEERVDVELD